MPQTVYIFDPETLAYLRSDQTVLDAKGNEPVFPPHHRSKTYVAPPAAQAGMKPIWDKNTQSWNEVEDHSGETVYTKDGGSPVVLKLGKRVYEQYGPIPDRFTDKPRPSEYHSWDDQANDWIEDTAAKDAAAAAALREANLKTDALELRTILKDGSPGEIAAYVRGKIDADAVGSIASAKDCLKRIETSIVILFKFLAVVAKE